MLIIGISIGFLIGLVVMCVAVWYLLKTKHPLVMPKNAPRIGSLIAVALMIGMMGFMQAHGVRADTATPYPTLNIPVAPVFDSTNNWMVTFAPIAAISIGIMLATKVLGYLGKSLGSAF
jgi:hypothetical protein